MCSKILIAEKAKSPSSVSQSAEALQNLKEISPWKRARASHYAIQFTGVPFGPRTLFSSLLLSLLATSFSFTLTRATADDPPRAKKGTTRSHTVDRERGGREESSEERNPFRNCKPPCSIPLLCRFLLSYPDTLPWPFPSLRKSHSPTPALSPFRRARLEY